MTTVRTDPHPLLTMLESCLLTFGLLTLGYAGFVWVEGRRSQVLGSRELDSLVARPGDYARPGRARGYPRGSLVGSVRVPRLGLSVIAFEGTDHDILDRGAGHLMGSAFPGEAGNTVFAAHRDTFFRPLEAIRQNDVVTVVTGKGTEQYRVESIAIVDPNRTDVLNDTPDPSLTLVTCYPFRFVGSAPKRFIVKCRRTGG